MILHLILRLSDFSSLYNGAPFELMDISNVDVLAQDKYYDIAHSPNNNLAHNEVSNPILTGPVDLSFNSIVDLCAKISSGITPFSFDASLYSSSFVPSIFYDDFNSYFLSANSSSVEQKNIWDCPVGIMEQQKSGSNK